MPVEPVTYPTSTEYPPPPTEKSKGPVLDGPTIEVTEDDGDPEVTIPPPGAPTCSIDNLQGPVDPNAPKPYFIVVEERNGMTIPAQFDPPNKAFEVGSRNRETAQAAADYLGMTRGGNLRVMRIR